MLLKDLPAFQGGGQEDILYQAQISGQKLFLFSLFK
jgi:hypothetical protein